MRATGRTIGAIVLALATLPAAAPDQRGQVTTDRAILTSMYGDVQTRHGTGGYRRAQLNEVLVPGDGVKTGASSRAELSVGQGGYVRMDENSQILVTAMAAGGTTTFQAIVGGIWVTIERALAGSRSFEVRMPSAVASVAGTVFRCEVSEQGSASVYVYEGEVDVAAGERHLRIAPAERCYIPHDLQAVVERFSLAGDDEFAWVMYNRHRDIVRALGDPPIIVALREQGLSELGSYLASRAIAGQLALHGLQSASVVEAGVTDFSFAPDGTIRWGRQPEADYCVIGDVVLEQCRQADGGLFSARVSCSIRLVHNADAQSLTSIEATVPGAGPERRSAIMAALGSLGRRVGAGLAPRIIRELMQRQAGAVRIDITGADRQQIAHLKRLVEGLDGVIRTAPLVLPGGRISLAAITPMTAQALGEALQGVAGDAVQRVLAGERVLHLRFTGPPGEAAPGAMTGPPPPPDAPPAQQPPAARVPRRAQPPRWPGVRP
ncbi:MAG: FecR domain-containing protein [Armatimonadota bacterium]